MTFTTPEAVRLIIASGGDGFDVLIHCLRNEPFLQGLIVFGLGVAIFSWWYDKYVDDKADWKGSDHL